MDEKSSISSLDIGAEVKAALERAQETTERSRELRAKLAKERRRG
jgi:hypothetical protein